MPLFSGRTGAYRARQQWRQASFVRRDRLDALPLASRHRVTCVLPAMLGSLLYAFERTPHMTAPESVTSRLAEWASQLTYEQIPPEVRREARRWERPTRTPFESPARRPICSAETRKRPSWEQPIRLRWFTRHSSMVLPR